MLNFFSLLEKHRSIRKFKDKDIDDKTINTILTHAINGSSSSGNLNSFSIIKTRDIARKEELYNIHYEQKLILEAPILLTFCADFNRTRHWLKSRDARDGFNDFLGFLVSAFDAIIVAQSTALACESKGFGICYLGTTLNKADKISRFLQLPRSVFPVTTMAVGHPNEFPEQRDRLSLSKILHEEFYHDYSGEDIKECYAEREITGWKRYMDIPECAIMMTEHNIKNLAQFYTSQIKYPPEEAQEASEMLLKLLKEKEYLRVVQE